MSNVELMAVCDINRDNAERIAGEVERLFGRKPLIFTDLDSMLANPDIAAVDVVTDGSSHHEIATAALSAGKHALVEKPRPLRFRACRRIIDAAEESGTVAGYRGELPPRSGQPDGARSDRRRTAGRPFTDDPDVAGRQRCDGGHAVAASEGEGGDRPGHGRSLRRYHPLLSRRIRAHLRTGADRGAGPPASPSPRITR